MLPRRHQNSGRQHDGKRFPAHLKFVRGFCCIAWKAERCEGKIEAAHVDYAGGKGMGMKVPDVFTVPACAAHHAEQHRIGWQSFEAKYGVDALAESRKLARISPSIIRAAREAGYQIGEEAEA